VIKRLDELERAGIVERVRQSPTDPSAAWQLATRHPQRNSKRCSPVLSSENKFTLNGALNALVLLASSAQA